MKLLILTNYFTPDLSAGSFRMQSLVDALEAWRENGLEVDLITTRPNRYASLKAEAAGFEDHGWLRINRIELPAHEGGMFDQARGYLDYARGVHAITGGKNWDMVFATSSRLMTAGLGALVSRRLGVPLYLDIRDLFTDNMNELLARSPLKLLMPVFRQIEKLAFRRATRINIVSEGFRPHILSIAPNASVSVYTNGIDDIFLSTDFTRERPVGDLPLVIYAGNFGEGQGLHRVVPDMAESLRGKARIRLIGDGARKKMLLDKLDEAGLDNVEILPPVPRKDLIEHYRQADILFLHLNDLKAFRKVLPSKIFEYAATGKPLVAGVAGYAGEFLSSKVPSAEVVSPLNADGLASAILRSTGTSKLCDRSMFREEFARSRIMAGMASDVIAVLKGAEEAPKVTHR